MSRKRHPRSTCINHVDIPENVRRDIILESDPVYASNLQSLTQRARLGKITAQEYTHLQQWLVESALRRAHVPRSQAPQLVHA